MHLFRSARGGARGVQIDSDTGSSTSHSSQNLQTDGTESDYSDETLPRAGLSRLSRGTASERGAPVSAAGMHRPPSARSHSSTCGRGNSSGRRTPPSVVSPRGFTHGAHLRSLSNGGAIVPVAFSGGALVPVTRSHPGGDSRSTSARGQTAQASGPQQPLQLRQLSESTRSMNASMAFSNYLANAMQEKKPTMNLLVVGAPQVGKSMFVNAYRAAVTNSLKWPTAPVGICGFYGTTSVEPYSNHPTDPSWMCIDTPGRFYDKEGEVLLEKLVEGMPWKTKLVGLRSLTLAEVKELTPIAANAAHQVVIVIPATDLVEDRGWGNVLRLRSRYAAAADAGQVVLYLKGLASLLRALMHDAAPFVLITKMDKVGGCQCYAAKEAVLSLVGQCVPVNRVYFAAFPEGATALSFKQYLTLDPATRENLIQMHEQVCFAVQWERRVADL